MEWSARVEWSTPESYSVADFDAIMDQLEQFHTAIGREQVPAGTAETWSAQMHVEAPTLLDGVARACELVEAATGQPVTGVEVIDAEVFGHRVELPCPCRTFVDDDEEIDLDKEVVILSSGRRLTNELAEQLVEEIRAKTRGQD